jgi:hypothetical protein
MLQVLYRFYDPNDCLLYVGISNNWIQRLRSHEKNSPFFALATRVTIEHYEDRESVERAEIESIRNDKPVFNKMHQIDDGSWKSHLRLLLEMATGLIDPDARHRRMFESESWKRLEFEPLDFISEFRAAWHYSTHYTVYRPRMICQACDELANNEVVKSWQIQLASVLK